MFQPLSDAGKARFLRMRLLASGLRFTFDDALAQSRSID
jgi:hypothetical protein